MPSGDTVLKGNKTQKSESTAGAGSMSEGPEKPEKPDKRDGPDKPDKPPKVRKTTASGKAAAVAKAPAEPPGHAPTPALRGAESIAAARDCALETAVLLDSIIHDLRTPLSAMSGWLEVLEAHFGEADGIVGRALLGLRRGVDSQTLGLSGLSDVLMKQRIEIPGEGDCTLLERLQLALQDMRQSADGPPDPTVAVRLAPFLALETAGSLTCQDAGTSLTEGCGTLLRALAAAQDPGDAPISVSANADKILITLPGGNGDPTALRSLCLGLAGYPTRRPEIRAQAIWLARSIFRRCGVAMEMSPAAAGGFHLLISKAPQA